MPSKAEAGVQNWPLALHGRGTRASEDSVPPSPPEGLHLTQTRLASGSPSVERPPRGRPVAALVFLNVEGQSSEPRAPPRSPRPALCPVRPVLLCLVPRWDTAGLWQRLQAPWGRLTPGQTTSLSAQVSCPGLAVAVSPTLARWSRPGGLGSRVTGVGGVPLWLEGGPCVTLAERPGGALPAPPL